MCGAPGHAAPGYGFFFIAGWRDRGRSRFCLLTWRRSGRRTRGRARRARGSPGRPRFALRVDRSIYLRWVPDGRGSLAGRGSRGAAGEGGGALPPLCVYMCVCPVRWGGALCRGGTAPHRHAPAHAAYAGTVRVRRSRNLSSYSGRWAQRCSKVCSVPRGWAHSSTTILSPRLLRRTGAVYTHDHTPPLWVAPP